MKPDVKKGIEKFFEIYSKEVFSELEGVGCGAYSPVYLGKKGNFSGWVVKGLCSPSSGLDKLEELQATYLGALSQRGVNMPESYVCKEDGVFYIKQKLVCSPTLLNIIQTKTLEEFLEALNSVAELSSSFFEQSDHGSFLGLDSRLENWTYNGDLELLDVYPPLYLDDRNLFSRFFGDTDFELDFARDPERSLLGNINKSLVRLIYEINSVKPEWVEECTNELSIVGKWNSRFVERVLKSARAGSSRTQIRGFDNGST